MPNKTILKGVGGTVKFVFHPRHPRFGNKEPKQYVASMNLLSLKENALFK